MHTETLSPFERAFSRASLQRAWEDVRLRRAGPGIDRVKVADFAMDAAQRLGELYDALHEGTWKPLPALRIALADDPERPIALSSVRDRVVQRALGVALAEAWETYAGDHVFAYRPRRSVQGAIVAAQAALRAGKHAWGRTDLRHFFQRVQAEPLLDKVEACWPDPRLRRVLMACLKAGALEGRGVYVDDEGLPQGSALSPVLSNIYLGDFDRGCDALPGVVLRYADDLLVLAATPEEVHACFEGMQHLCEPLGLSLNARKTAKGHASAGLVFLGMALDSRARVVPAKGIQSLSERLGRLWPQDRSSAAQTLALWEDWYGRLSPAHLTHVGAIGVCLEREATCWREVEERPEEALEEGVDASLLWAMLRRRAWLAAQPGSASPEQGLALLRLWLAAVDHVHEAEAASGGALVVDLPLSQRKALLRALEVAAVREARLATKEDGVTRAVEVATLLGLPVDAAPEPSWDAEAWARAFARAGQGVRAVAVAELAREEAMGTLVQERPTRVERDIGESLALLRRRLGEPPLFQERTDERGHLRHDRPVGWEASVLARHLGGEVSVGASFSPSDRVTSALLLCMVPPRPPRVDQVPKGRSEEMLAAVAHEAQLIAERASFWARRVVQHLRRRGVPGLLESQGQGRWRWWSFLEEPAAVGRAARYLRVLLADLGDPPDGFQLRILPQGVRGRRTTGWVEPLPLGRCRRSGQWSVLVDDQLEPLVAPWAALEEVATISRAQLDVVLGDVATGPGSAGRTAPAVQRVMGVLSAHPRAGQILAGCRVLMSVVRKGAELGVLDPLEQNSLYEVLGHLSDADAKPVLSAVLREVGPVTDEKVRRRLRKLSPQPLSCAKLQQRHPGHGLPCGGCGARAGFAGGAEPSEPCVSREAPDVWTRAAYRSPLLHAEGIQGFSFLTRDGRYVTPRAQQVQAQSASDAQVRAQRRLFLAGPSAGGEGRVVSMRENDHAGVEEGRSAVQGGQGVSPVQPCDPLAAPPRVGAVEGTLGEAGSTGERSTRPTPRVGAVEGMLGASVRPEASSAGPRETHGDVMRRAEPSGEAAGVGRSTPRETPGDVTRRVDASGVGVFLLGQPQADAGDEDVAGSAAHRTPEARAPLPRAEGVEGPECVGEVDAVFQRLLEARREESEARRALARCFEERGVQRLRLAVGWLVYVPGEPPRFVLEC